MYAKESDFSKALLASLKTKGAWCTRIETGSTGQGVPDIFIVTNKLCRWLELKNNSKDLVEEYITTSKKICYRPGQLAWHYMYHTKTEQDVFLILACKNGYIILLKRDFEKQNITKNDIVYIFHNIGNVVDCILKYKGEQYETTV